MKKPRRSSKFLYASIAILLAAWGFMYFKTTTERERSFIIIKPDGVEKGLTDIIYDRFRAELDLQMVLEQSVVQASTDTLSRHYAEHKDRSFFGDLVRFMQSGPVRVSVWEGKRGTVAAIRDLVGPTDPSKASETTIRGKFGSSVQQNVIHASDSIESAKRETDIWFR
jgi:nucleoside-diphosphate kinase